MNLTDNIILAKPSGITLEQHVFDVISEANMVLSTVPFVSSKYFSLVGKDLQKRLEVVCKLHDDGKKHPKWQTACQLDYKIFREQVGSNSNDTHIVPQGKNLLTTGIRHEFQSLIYNAKKNLPLALQCAIAAHHSKLGFAFEKRWLEEGAEQIWKEIKKESYHISEKKSIAESAKKFYEYAGLRGLLQLADHRASALEDSKIVPQINTFEYNFPHKEKRGIQKLIEEYWQEDMLLVRAPTGAGKTDASLLWASKQIKNNRAARLIIAMPTRFTSNALAINVSETLSDTGLYHSSAWFSKFQSDIDEGVLSFDYASKVHEFARLLETPITVCTIDHLLTSLTLTREDHHLIDFNMANSCLVIDEADFYDDFTLANILVLLEILHEYKVPVLIMSASLPETSIKMYQKTGYKVDRIIEDDSDNERERFCIKTIKVYNDLSDIEDLLFKCAEKKNAIIYANTVDKATSIYKWFIEHGFADTNPILYHSRFTETDKKRKENELIDALGRMAWEEHRANGIAILTQIGEMSINISADFMISDICPIDRLTQRAGRLCRFDINKIGELHVLIPQKNGSLYPAPYGSFHKKEKEWKPCNALLQTISLLQIQGYSARNLVDLINNVYSKDFVFSVSAKTNAKTLKDYFINNWLINPIQKTEIDEEETVFWKSRNIDPSETVFVTKPHQMTWDKLSYQAWKIANSIEIPMYLVKKGEKNHRIDICEVVIKGESERIKVIRNGFYNYEFGIDFNDDENDNFL